MQINDLTLYDVMLRIIRDPDSVMENVHTLQAKYCRNKNSDMYRMLSILQHV